MTLYKNLDSNKIKIDGESYKNIFTNFVEYMAMNSEMNMTMKIWQSLYYQ